MKNNESGGSMKNNESGGSMKDRDDQLRTATILLGVVLILFSAQDAWARKYYSGESSYYAEQARQRAVNDAQIRNFYREQARQRAVNDAQIRNFYREQARQRAVHDAQIRNFYAEQARQNALNRAQITRYYSQHSSQPTYRSSSPVLTHDHGSGYYYEVDGHLVQISPSSIPPIELKIHGVDQVAGKDETKDKSSTDVTVLGANADPNKNKHISFWEFNGKRVHYRVIRANGEDLNKTQEEKDLRAELEAIVGRFLASKPTSELTTNAGHNIVYKGEEYSIRFFYPVKNDEMNTFEGDEKKELALMLYRQVSLMLNPTGNAQVKAEIQENGETPGAKKETKHGPVIPRIIGLKGSEDEARYLDAQRPLVSGKVPEDCSAFEFRTSSKGNNLFIGQKGNSKKGKDALVVGVVNPVSLWCIKDRVAVIASGIWKGEGLVTVSLEGTLKNYLTEKEDRYSSSDGKNVLMIFEKNALLNVLSANEGAFSVVRVGLSSLDNKISIFRVWAKNEDGSWVDSYIHEVSSDGKESSAGVYERIIEEVEFFQNKEEVR